MIRLSAKRSVWWIIIIFFAFLIAVFFSQNPRRKSVQKLPAPTGKEIPLHAAWQDAAAAEPPRGDDTERVLVTRVIDGDTIEIEGGARVRYIGIDTPETVDPRKPVQCFGAEASQRNKELVEGKQARMEKDTSETDRYGRLLRYVFIGDTMINLRLVAEGYAHAATFPPDVAHHREFLAAEREARSEQRGLWTACPINIKNK